MMNRAEFERLLDVYGFRCERFGQDLSTHARAQVVSAFAALASAPVALTDTERSAITGLIAVARAAFNLADDAEDDGDHIKVGRADANALGETLETLEELPDDQPGYTMGPSNKAEWALRRLLGNASAPVAGEAQPTAYLTLDEEGSPSMLFFDVVEARTYCAPDEEPEPLFRHAAPQASEAVRDAALEEAAVIAETAPDYLQDSTFDGAARAIRALKTQADKGGGDCAKGAGDEDEQNAEAWLIEWQPGDGNTWVEADANEVRAREKAKRMGGTATPMVRAALASQPAAQKHPRTDGGGRGS